MGREKGFVVVLTVYKSGDAAGSMIPGALPE